MGGLSRGDAVWSGRESLVFTGVISLANGGGFASIRSAPGRYNLAGRESIVLKCSGDGRRYKLSLRTDISFDGISWQAEFDAPPGWREIIVPVGSLLPTWHGRIVENADVFAAGDVRTFGFLIAGGQDGPFELQIASVSSR